MFLLLQLISKLKKISIHYCVLISFTAISSLSTWAMDTPSGSPDASSGSEGELINVDFNPTFNFVKDIEDKLLSECYNELFQDSTTQLNKRLEPLYSVPTHELDQFLVELTVIISVENLSAIERICLLEKIIRYVQESEKTISSLNLSIEEKYEYELELSYSPKQPGNGELKNIIKDIGFSYKYFLETVKKNVEKKQTIEKLKKNLIKQKKSGKLLGINSQEMERYYSGFNLVLDYEVARRRIDGDIYHKAPLLLCIYYLLDNLHDDDILEKCLSGTNYLFMGDDREDSIDDILSNTLNKYELRGDDWRPDSKSIRKFLLDKFASDKLKEMLEREQQEAISELSIDDGEEEEEELPSRGEKKPVQGKKSTKLKVVTLVEEGPSSDKGKVNRKKPENKSSVSKVKGKKLSAKEKKKDKKAKGRLTSSSSSTDSESS
ncbi:MAG: hypothetical protein K0M45_00270 [Candidatus Paracaedibacteraceae bacterium]|nr:hypothetical protein [Candidatus Paracaedibacteraceae bacterium]